MSDVERITHQNHQRVRWAEEYSDNNVVQTPSRRYKANKQKRHRRLRTVAMGCSMFSGTGAAFVGIGLSMMHLPTIICGIIAAIAFMACGYFFEIAAEGGEDNV